MNDSLSAPAPLRVAATRYLNGGTIKFSTYRTGETAISIVDESGDESMATVSLLRYGALHPGKHGVWLKGWSENEGLPEALVDAGVVTLSGRSLQCGFANAQHAELTPAACTARILALDLKYVTRLLQAELNADEESQHLPGQMPEGFLVRLPNLLL